MRAAATLEDRTEKSAVTPGPLAPARELLGEMLLELEAAGRSALKEFEATLKKEPNRFRALYGAARAASLAGRSRSGARVLRVSCSRSANAPTRPAVPSWSRRAARVGETVKSNGDVYVSIAI